MAGTINGFCKGTQMNAGFDLGAQLLLDSRCLAKDLEELNNMPAIRRANGLTVWVQDERRLYAWDEPAAQWTPVGDTNEGDFDVFKDAFEAAEMEKTKGG